MLTRISGVVLRNIYLYRRSVTRSMQIIFWPVMDLLVWGFLTTYLDSFEGEASRAAVFLIGSLIFWDFLYRTQQAISLAITEEIWVKNVINLFVAPISVPELLIGWSFIGLIKGMLTAILLGVLAYFFYGFQILDLGLPMLGYFFSLLMFGWAVGMVTSAMIIRFGHAAEALVWGVPFLIQPFAAVFYPVSVLPEWLQWFSLALPATHVFEGMREILQTGVYSWGPLINSLMLNALYLTIGSFFFAWMLKRARDKGYLARLGME